MNDILRNRIQLVLTSAGILIAGYLSVTTMLGVEAACGKGGGCGEVAASSYSKIAGVPVAYLGLLSYVALFVMAMLKTMNGDPDRKLHKVGLMVSSAGAAFSIFLMYASFAIVKATCPWCVSSAITMTLLFISHLLPRKGESVAHFSPLWTGAPIVASLIGLTVLVLNIENPLKPVPGYTIEMLTPKNPNMFGDPQAKVSVVEFYDLTCPHCKASYEEFKRLLQEGSKLKIIMRHFPLRSPGHEMGLPGAIFSEMAAEKGQYFQFVDAIFAKEGKFGVPDMLDLLVGMGFDREEVKKRAVDQNDPAFLRVKEDIAMADKLGLLITPTFYVGLPGKQVYPAKQSSMKDVLAKPEIRAEWEVKK
ncbi:MAG: vitamin K epoxide reductase family protein [Methanoregulaceae archaeon]|nr:vitamin K epoxide reductase family protein [Methanoregulaceae archaeon]